MNRKSAIVVAFAVTVICGGLPMFAPATAQQAARTADPYAQGLLWRIDRAGAAPSHVFGTIHLSDARVTALPAAVRERFDAAEIFAMEVMLDPANVLKLVTRMVYPDGRELPATIGPALYEKVVARSASLGWPPDVLRRMKPWAVALMLMTPGQNAPEVLDHRLYSRALEQKKQVHALETVEEQVSAFENLTEGEQVTLLKLALANHAKLPGRVERAVAAYLQRDLAALQRLSDEDVPQDPAGRRLHANLMQRLLDERNTRMAERIEVRLQSGGAFVAVGALHLYGERGILARLASRGFRVTRIY